MNEVAHDFLFGWFMENSKINVGFFFGFFDFSLKIVPVIVLQPFKQWTYRQTFSSIMASLLRVSNFLKCVAFSRCRRALSSEQKTCFFVKFLHARGNDSHLHSSTNKKKSKHVLKLGISVGILLGINFEEEILLAPWLKWQKIWGSRGTEKVNMVGTFQIHHPKPETKIFFSSKK